jgi:hypothetical protein
MSCRLMSQGQLPLWVQYLQALGAPLLAGVIAAVGALLAWQPVKLARVRLQHDLYDRRFAVFEVARKLLADVLAQSNATDEQIRSYVIGTAEARFLVNDDISTYLNEIRTRASRLRAINATMSPLPVGDQRTALAQEEKRIFAWMMEQVDVLVEKFRPFLTLER